MRGALSQYYEMSYKDLLIAIVGYRSAKSKEHLEQWKMVNYLGYYSMAMHVSKKDRRVLERQMIGQFIESKLKVLTKDEAHLKTKENLDFFKNLKTA